MTTFVPRPPYTREELEQLYPRSVQLQLVQVVSSLQQCWFWLFLVSVYNVVIKVNLFPDK